MSIKNKAVLLSAVGILAGASVLNANAATSSTTMDVTANVVAVCNITAYNLAFGTYNPLSGTDLDSTSRIDVSCTSGTAFNVGLDAGNGSGATVSGRKMTISGGSDTLGYKIFKDTERTSNWGNTVGTDTMSGTTSAILTAYGRIESGQSVPIGSYSDTLNVTVTF